MTILNIIYAILILVLLWSFYEDYKVNKDYKKALLEKQELEQTLS